MAASAEYTRNYSSDYRTDKVSEGIYHKPVEAARKRAIREQHPQEVRRGSKGLKPQQHTQSLLLLLTMILQAQLLNLACQRIAADAKQRGSFDASPASVLQSL